LDVPKYGKSLSVLYGPLCKHTSKQKYILVPSLELGYFFDLLSAFVQLVFDEGSPTSASERRDTLQRVRKEIPEKMREKSVLKT